MHGSGRLYSGCYSTEELQDLAKFLAPHLREGKEVAVYFNNDIGGHAVNNARELQQILEGMLRSA